MRLFLGIDLPDSVASATATIAGNLRSRLAKAAPRTSLRWVPVENLHVTVWFLGEVRDPHAGALVETLRPALGLTPFNLRVAGAGLFPRTGAPRVLWLSFSDGRREMSAVYARLQPRLMSLGFEPEKRPYDPHLTIARVKDCPRQEIAAVRGILAETRADAGGCLVDAVTLFRSRTSPHGSQYERLLRVPLQ